MDKLHLLFRPQGGLGSSLEGFVKCYDYAVEHKRRLSIDFSDENFSTEFLGLFDVPDKAMSRYLSLSKKKTEALRLRGEDVTQGQDSPIYLNVHSSEQVLIYDRTEAGKGQSALNKLILKPRLARKILSRQNSLEGLAYVGLYVESITSDYLELFSKIYSECRGKTILFSSPSSTVRGQALGYFDKSELIFLSSESEITNGSSLNFHSESLLSDIVTLALAEQLFIAQTSDPIDSVLSPILAHLHDHPEILRRLLRQS